MRQIFVDQDYTRVGLFKSILDEAGIANFIRNQYSNNSAEGLQGAAIFPALCVINDEDYDAAMKVLGPIYYGTPTQAADWRCPKCEAEVPGNFDSCWQCGSIRAE